MRETTPGCCPPRPGRPPVCLFAEVVLLAVEVARDTLRGDLAADVLAVLEPVVFDPVNRPDAEVERVDPEPPLLPRPLDDVFDRADVVLRDEDDLEPLLVEDPPRADALPLLELPPLLLPREDEPPLVEREEPVRLLDDAFPPLRPAALF
jgi:hypothetical protein